MDTKTKAAARGDGQAAQATVLAVQAKDTTRRADPITFYLPINDRFRLTADERCWRIEQRRKGGEWRPVEYHTTIDAAVNNLSGRLLRTAEVQSLADALGAIENVSRTLTRALAPRFKAERRQ
ncbi:MAG: hypothetical protein H0V34_13995 [Gammaproteobacteria bacterium]|nr:hypothetical protein [Gammaproteobacteria bacterium]